MANTTDARLTAARLLDTDEPIGVNAWPLGSYVSEAIENEMDTFTARERAKPYETRLALAINRACSVAAVYAEPWGLDPIVFRAALDIRR